MSVRAFPERINWRRKINSKCGQHGFMGRGSQKSKMRKRTEYLASKFLRFLTMDPKDQLLMPRSATMIGYPPKSWAKISPASLPLSLPDVLYGSEDGRCNPVLSYQLASLTELEKASCEHLPGKESLLGSWVEGRVQLLESPWRMVTLVCCNKSLPTRLLKQWRARWLRYEPPSP